MKAHRGEAVVRDVLEAVREEIARVGFRALRIEDVAARAEVAKTTIYRRWPKKEDLLFDLLRTMVVDVEELPETGSLRETLLAVATHVEALMTNPDGIAIGRMMMAERSEPALERVIERMREHNIRAPRELLERARERGELCAHIDTELLLTTLIGAVHHRLHIQNLPPSRVHLEAIVDLLIEGARPRPSADTSSAARNCTTVGSGAGSECGTSDQSSEPSGTSASPPSFSR